MKEAGYVYILTNKSFKEDWVKIGKSSRPVDVRSKELDNTAVPLPFDIYATLRTSKYSEVEKLIHRTIDMFTDLRIRQNREFFNVTPEKALEVFKLHATTLDDAVIEDYHTGERRVIYSTLEEPIAEKPDTKELPLKVDIKEGESKVNFMRVIPGQGCMYAEEFVKEGYVGIGFLHGENLSDRLFDKYEKTRDILGPLYLEQHPDKNKIHAGLAVGCIWTVCKYLKKGDIILLANGNSCYVVGKIVGDYEYCPGSPMSHRRKVEWSSRIISRTEMSDGLRHSSGSIGTCCDLTKYSEELTKPIEK